MAGPANGGIGQGEYHQYHEGRLPIYCSEDHLPQFVVVNGYFIEASFMSDYKSSLQWVPLGVLVAALGVSAPIADACMAVPPFDSDPNSLHVAGEEAIIVWDAKSQTQHFIRRATFHTKVDSFAFLVPTPSVPELTEVNDTVFDDLANAVKPEVIEKWKYKFETCWLIMLPFRSPVAMTFVNVESQVEEPPVQVIHRQQVAGYDAAVLRARDVQSLIDWLNENGFAFQSAAADWLDPYVEQEWVITAFKHATAGNARAKELNTEAVRMSFHAERPFFPYREPVEQGRRSKAQRSLTVYFVGDTRIDGLIGESRTPWPVETKYAAKRDDLGPILARLLPPAVMSVDQPLWLTAAVDNSRIRPGQGGDLFFNASAVQKEVIPPPIIRYTGTTKIPIVLDLLYVVPITVWVIRRNRRSSMRSAPMPG